MKNTLILFTISVIFYLTSCSDIGKSDHLKAIKAMNNSLDSIQKELYANQIDTLPELITATITTELRIKNNYTSDTIDMEFGKKMDAFKRARRRIKPVGKIYSNVRVGVVEEKEVLTKLEKDITNGNGDRSKYSEYIVFEQNKVDQLRKLLHAYVTEKNSTLKELERTFPEIYALSLKFEAENKIKK